MTELHRVTLDFGSGVARDRRPLLLAGITAVLSSGLLILAVARGWLGADVGRGAQFCESAPGWVVLQPANTFSNVGFIAAGILIAWHAGARVGLLGHRPLATVMACLVVLLGPASAAMHATQSAAGGHLDLLSMYLIASFVVAYAVMRWVRGGVRLFAITFLGGVGFCELIGAWPYGLPVVMHAGNAAFAFLLGLSVVLEVLIMRRGETRTRRRYGYLSLAAVLGAFVVWNATKTWLCDPDSLIQGHAIWHLMCAVAVYSLYRYYASESDRGPASPIRVDPMRTPAHS